MYPFAPVQAWDVNAVAGSAQTVKAAPGSGSRLVVVGWVLTDDTGGQIKMFFGSDTAANRILNQYAAANGGSEREFAQGRCLRGAENTALLITPPGNCYGTVYGYVEAVETVN